MNKAGIWEFYNPESKYFAEDHTEITKEIFHTNYPVAFAEKMCVRVSGSTMHEAESIMYLRSVYEIDSEYSDEEAINVINNKYKLNASISDPLERIASALEYLVLLNYQEGL